MSGVRSGLKNELKGTQTEVKLTEINGVFLLKFYMASFLSTVAL